MRDHRLRLLDILDAISQIEAYSNQERTAGVGTGMGLVERTARLAMPASLRASGVLSCMSGGVVIHCLM